MKNLYKSLLAALVAVAIISCEALDLDLQENPDALTLESADVDLIFNTLQFNFRNQNRSMANTTDQALRLVGQFGTYTPGQGTMNGVWNQVYNTQTNLEALRVFAEEEGYTFHYGVGQIMLATMYVNIVDYVGTAVFSEANNAAEFPNPGLDPGEDIYEGVFALIEEGLSNINGPGRAPVNDLFYGGSKDSWIAYANTLKLRMYLQTRLVNPSESAAGINSVISSGSYIDQISEDLQFQYGTSAGAFESRHPLFTGNYINGAGTYMSNSLMSYMKDSVQLDVQINAQDTVLSDPRLRYYFYRQTEFDPYGDDAADAQGGLLPCLGEPGYDYCWVGDSYWGRDHADNEGIPGDGNLRTTYGVYPARGAFDDGSFIAAQNTSATGNGIAPLMLSSWVNFMLAESALTLGTTGDAATYLETGIRQSMAKVESFAPGNMYQEAIDRYVEIVLDNYANAANDDKRLEIIIKEWYLASFPSGLLPYNNYRRTGYPVLQAPIIAAGEFPRSFFLPESELNSNANPDFGDQKSITDKVFWDTNPDGFIN